MATFKCKMCGEDIKTMDDAASGACKCCGTTSTFSKEIDERVARKALEIEKKSVPLTASVTATVAVAPGIESLMKRGHMFLEDGDWSQADVYFDRVLDIDPEHAPAYIGKLCAELHLKSEMELSEHPEPSENKLYIKAIRFADEAYLQQLKNYERTFQESLDGNKQKLIEERAKIAEFQGLLTIWGGMLVGLRDDGTIIMERLGYSPAAEDEKEFDRYINEVSGWIGIVAMHAYGGKIIGVKNDGTVVGVNIDDVNDKKINIALPDMNFIAASIGEAGIFALTSDGRIAHIESFFGEHIDVGDWTKIAKISTGLDFVAGLKTDGTVVVSNNLNASNICNIVDIAADNTKSIVYCLKDDGTVISVGKEGNKVLDLKNILSFSSGNFSSGNIYDNSSRQMQKKMENISPCEYLLDINRGRYGIGEDLVAISCGIIKYSYRGGGRGLIDIYSNTNVYVDMKSNGTINIYQTGNENRSFRWEDIKTHSKEKIQNNEKIAKSVREILAKEKIYVSINGTETEWSSFALNKNGKIVKLGICSDLERDKNYIRDHEYFLSCIAKWDKIIAFSCGDFHAACVKIDGTVISVGSNKSGQCDTEYWDNVVDVVCASQMTIGVKSGGTIVTAGTNYKYDAVKNWRNVKTLVATYDRAACLNYNGKVIATHPGNDKAEHVFGRGGIIAISFGGTELFAVTYSGALISDGETSFSNNWRNIVDVSACEAMVAGLKSDGTVIVQMLDDRWGMPDTKNWTDIVSISCGGPGIIIGVKKNGETIFAHDMDSRKADSYSSKYARPILDIANNIKPVDKNFLEQARIIEEREQQKKNIMEERNKLGLCMKCGGELSLFFKKCKSCGAYRWFM